MKLKRLSQQKASIDMTPVIDIVFQLLTFFMITSTYIETSAINVDLPSAETSDVQPVQDAVVTLRKDGSITLNEQYSSLDTLGGEIRELYIDNNNLVVTIRGDKGIDYGSLIKVMDIVRLTGVSRMSLATSLTREMEETDDSE